MSNREIASNILDNLTDELVDDVQFDANWYQVPTKEELEAFYVENFSSASVNNDDIPMDIPPLVTAAKPAPVKESKPAPAPVEDPVAKDVTEDSDDLPPPAPAPKATPKKEAAKVEPKKETPAPTEDINQKIDDILLGSRYILQLARILKTHDHGCQSGIFLREDRLQEVPRAGHIHCRAKAVP